MTQTAQRQFFDHPNIAKVPDAGATQHGRPYFVMELVRGIKITDYCDRANLSTGDRLQLFIAVCQAVQHAHQKGIIHRDLKPSNILVTLHDTVPVPKVIDFGVAKATQARLTALTIYTQFQQMIGTPLRMSPEQAEMSASTSARAATSIRPACFAVVRGRGRAAPSFDRAAHDGTRRAHGGREASPDRAAQARRPAARVPAARKTSSSGKPFSKRCGEVLLLRSLCFPARQRSGPEPVEWLL